jgi:hypothetical protein
MKVLLALALTLFSLSRFAWSQAHVPESEETAQLYVDGTTGSDSNPGTAAEPLKTIHKAMVLAVANNHNSIGTQVIIEPGPYRESVVRDAATGDTSLPITFQAAMPGTVIVSGADVWTGWEPGTGQLYTHSWPYTWGFCDDEPNSHNQLPIMNRREMIFINGSPLTQVLSTSQLMEGTFAVDETNEVVTIWPPSGTDVSTATIEVAIRPSDLSISGVSNMVFRDMTFEYANTCRPSGAATVLGKSNNILLDTDQFIWNNAAGLNFTAESNQLTVRYSVAKHNGEVGYISSDVKQLLYKNDQALFNNWRGAQGSYYTHDAAGGDFFHTHDSTFPHFKTQMNQAPGIHWDTDGLNLKADSLVSSFNLIDGVEVEKSEGPVEISNASVCHNGVAPTFVRTSGLNLRESEYTTVSDSSFLQDGYAEVLIEGIAGGIFVTNWETGRGALLFDMYDTLSQDTIVSGPQHYVFHDILGGPDWTLFSSTLNSNNNDWWNNSSKADFQIRVPEPGTLLNFAQWQLATGQDLNSVWAAPSQKIGSVCDAKSDIPDFWLIAQTEVYSFVIPILPNTAIINLTTVPLGLSGTVNLAVDVSGVPGATASLSASSITTAGSSILQVSAPPGHQHGTFPVTVFGTTGGITRTLTFALEW